MVTKCFIFITLAAAAPSVAQSYYRMRNKKKCKMNPLPQIKATLPPKEIQFLSL